MAVILGFDMLPPQVGQKAFYLFMRVLHAVPFFVSRTTHLAFHQGQHTWHASHWFSRLYLTNFPARKEIYCICSETKFQNRLMAQPCFTIEKPMTW